MEQFNFIQKAKEGDLSAFSEWMDQYSAEIERLVFQYGYVGQQAGEITETIFRAFHTDLVNVENEQQAPLELFRIAIQVLRGMPVSLSDDTFFKFEEDERLHRELIKLDNELKIPFLLSIFHNKSFEEIATISQRGEMDVTQAVEDAMLRLNLHQQDKSIEFIHKSYNRLPLTFKKENVLNPKKNKVETGQSKKTGISKKSIGIWLAGILLLFAIITVPIVTSEEYRASASERFTEQLAASFEKEMAQTYTQLGFTEPTPEEVNEQFIVEYFGQNVRLQFKILQNNLKRKIERGDVLDKKKIQKDYADILKGLELPSEMVDSLNSHPLVSDADKSGEFIQEYIRKYHSIQNAYYTIVAKHEPFIKQMMDQTDFEDVHQALLENPDTPAELANALKGMKSQNIEVILIKEWDAIVPSFSENGLDEKIRAALHEDVGGYILIISAVNNLYYSFKDPLEFEIKYEYLMDMERSLLHTKKQSEIYDHLRSVYNGLFYELVIGSEPEERFGVDGKLKNEFRELWTRLAETDGNSPSAYAMKQIIKELEANEWKRPSNYEYLNSPIFEAVEAARQGNLDSFVWELPTFHEEPFIENNTFNPEMGIANTVDSDYRATVETVYNKLSAVQNKDVLATIEPIIVLGVYLYANELEDPGTMWLLSNHETINKTKEEFIESWNKQKLEIDESEVVYAETGGNEVNGTPLIPIRYKFQEEEIYDGWLIWNSDLEIWEIHTPPGNVTG